MTEMVGRDNLCQWRSVRKRPFAPQRHFLKPVLPESKRALEAVGLSQTSILPTSRIKDEHRDLHIGLKGQNYEFMERTRHLAWHHQCGLHLFKAADRWVAEDWIIGKVTGGWRDADVHYYMSSGGGKKQAIIWRSGFEACGNNSVYYDWR